MTTVVCTIATPNFLHYALNLVRSVREHWSTAIPVYIAIVGARGIELPAFEISQDVALLRDEDLGIADLGWLAAKYTPTELCCALKPTLVSQLFDRGFERVVYVDADLHFFGAPLGLLECAPQASIVLTPHVTSPLPEDEAWSRPSLGDLYASGMMNGGLLLARRTPAARRLLAIWATLVSGPGAFVADLGPQHEQNSLNWLLAFSEDVAICRDRTINVAYWNLHERPLRWTGLDGGDEDRWLLDGQPIVCFHFSGFELAGERLSRHDHRHWLDIDVNVHALRAFYVRRLQEAGAERFASLAYAYGEVDGHRLAPSARDVLKRGERSLRERPRVARWPEDLVPVLSELASTIGPARLLPEYLDFIVQGRLDLHPHSDATFPRALLQWAAEWLHIEYGSSFLFEAYTPFAYERAALEGLAKEISAVLADPGIDLDILRRERIALIRRLEAAGASELALRVRRAQYRFAAYEPALCLRLIHSSRVDLVASFPDPMGADWPGFRSWLGANLELEYEVPENVQKCLASLDPQLSLARLVGTLRREVPRHARFLAGGLSPGFLGELVPLSSAGVGFSASDLTLVDWWSRSAPIEGDRRTDVAAPRAWLSPGRLLPARMRGLRGARGEDSAALPPQRVPARRTTTVERWHATLDRAGHLDERSRDPRGLNVFGYYRSPIGLGSWTRGLCRALTRARFAVREVVLTNETMDGDFALADLTPDPGFWYPRNLVVSYPHHRAPVFEVFPPALFGDRETVGHFAWEQRDMHPLWANDLGRYDRLLAISSFSAEALERATGRPVGVVPCVVEIDETAARVHGRSEFGLPTDAFVAGVLFDASSSLQRKNPGAAVRALVRAFGGCRDVVIVLKVTNGDRRSFAGEVAGFIRELRDAGLDTRCFTESMPSARVHGLVAALDLCLSLHRAEGFGYALAEAMWLGVPAVATRYSGNLDFMDDQNSWLVRCSEVLVTRPEGPYRRGTVWAEADVAEAAEHCRAIYEDRSGAALRAARGRDAVRRLLSAEAVAGRLEALLA